MAEDESTKLSCWGPGDGGRGMRFPRKVENDNLHFLLSDDVVGYAINRQSIDLSSDMLECPCTIVGLSHL